MVLPGVLTVARGEAAEDCLRKEDKHNRKVGSFRQTHAGACRGLLAWDLFDGVPSRASRGPCNWRGLLVTLFKGHTLNGTINLCLQPFEPEVQNGCVRVHKTLSLCHILSVGSYHTLFSGTSVCGHRVASIKFGQPKNGYGISLQVP